MIIRRLALTAGAEAATGPAVIIDVFRSFSSEPLLIHLGVAAAVPVRPVSYN